MPTSTFISEAPNEDFDVALSQKWTGCLMPWHLDGQGLSTVFFTTKNGLGLVGHGDASREVYEEVLMVDFLGKKNMSVP